MSIFTTVARNHAPPCARRRQDVQPVAPATASAPEAARADHARAPARGFSPAISLPLRPSVSYDMPANSGCAAGERGEHVARQRVVLGRRRARRADRRARTSSGRAKPGAAFACMKRCTRPRRLVNVPSSSAKLAIGSTAAARWRAHGGSVVADDDRSRSPSRRPPRRRRPALRRRRRARRRLRGRRAASRSA